MREREIVFRELRRRAAIGFPWGALLVFLVFLLGNLFSVPGPAGTSVQVVSAAMAEKWGDPVSAALVQLVWSGLLGAALETAEVPFLLERRTALWSLAHFLVTAAVFSLAGWQCGWFPHRETWLCLLGLLLLCYVMRWSVRFIGWQADIRAIRSSAGLQSPETPGGTLLPYLLLAAGVELLLPPVLALLDARDVPVLTGIFYPFLLLPLFCFLSACPLGTRLRRWWLLYPPVCALLTLPCVFLLYNVSALFQAGFAAISALVGGTLGMVLRRMGKKSG